MPFTITAELPLGTYRGAQADGRVERVPSVARLYSALLCAAGFGPRALSTGETTVPCPADEEALRWIEQTPPDRVRIPALEVNAGRTTAYRADGTIKKTTTSMSIKKLAKAPDVSVAVDGVFCWIWDQTPPAAVVAALSALCPDVPYLGTTESPVRLRTSAAETPPGAAASGGEFILDPDAGPFSSAGGEDIALPLPGRFDELTRAHIATAEKPPSAARDRWSSDEISSASALPDREVALARYAPTLPPTADVPWTSVLILPIDTFVRERDRVGMAVAVHRALISALGEGAPTLITGEYGLGAARPVNRLAIHFVDDSLPLDLRGHRSAVAVFLPPAVSAAELDAVAQAVDTLHTIRAGRSGAATVNGATWSVPGHRFWRTPSPGLVRTWRTSPPAVPDVRGARNGRAVPAGRRGNGGSGNAWTFGHAALLSLAFTWRAQLPQVSGRGDERNRQLVQAANDAGAAVLSAAPVRDTDVRPYFHKVHDDAVVRPYRARLWLGDLASSETVMAIGQSRHLGGGLLVPVDAPAQARSGAGLITSAGDR
ncbi:type I-U CRISPR-associated protein Csb2 [Lapillicoccus sp.]|uniref:type I-G CRISPR-associated protein Csb2 n=1 Tax=Lapillicoccus sp. TaxID=1909287 RepID=UPI0025F6ABD4|nr:type I-U CRISPR-associated protein Csb2 [Lapillicoccus sp.]